jgi:macrolide transport system ATP-binding/permease protein
MSWRKYFGRAKQDAELAAEMESHLAHEVDEFVARGMTREEAQHAAHRKLGSVRRVREDVYEMNSLGFIETLWQDVRYAVRMLRKSPGYAAVAIFTLALGIGANTAVFSVINTVLLRTSPVRDPANLFLVSWEANKAPDMEWQSSYGDCAGGRSSPNPSDCTFPRGTYEGLLDDSKVFSSVAAFAGPSELQMSGNGAASVVRAITVSGEYFATLGVNPVIGRTLTREDDRPDPSNVVLSYAFWQSNFGGDPGVLGRTIALNGAAFNIVGVAEQKFTNLSPGKTQDLWLTIAASKTMGIKWAKRSDGISNWWLVIVARLAPGVTRAQAESEASVIFGNQILHGEKPLAKAEDNARIVLTPVQSGLTGRRQRYSTRLYVLMCAVGLILLIACANVAGLLLARSAARRKEIALRLALGARRTRIVRQLLTESLLLSFIGGTVGIAFAFWGVKTITALLGGGSAEDFAFAVTPDWRVLAFTLGASTLTGIFFGLAPALRTTRLDLTSSLKENAPVNAISGEGAWWQRLQTGNVLVVAQVALCVVVMIGAGLLVRTVNNLRRIDPGFDTKNVLLFDVDPTRTGMNDEQAASLYNQLREKFAALPGVASATYSSGELMSGGQWREGVRAEGSASEKAESVDVLSIGPDFLHAARIPLLAGREFTSEDFERASTKYNEQLKLAQEIDSGKKVDENAQLTIVPVLVNRAFAAKYLAGKEPIGRALTRGGYSGATNGRNNEPPSREYEIVGVVADTKYGTLRDAIAPLLILPNVTGGVEFQLRTASDPEALVPVVREVVKKADAELPVTAVRTLTQQIDHLMEAELFLARLVSIAAGLALLLSCVGLYGLLSYEVSRRTREIGVRMALGAKRGDVLRMVLGHGVRLALIGVASGAAVAASVTRFLQSFLYEVKANDPITFAAIGLLILCVSVAASYVPTRRATRVDPMVALRYE